MIQNTQTHWGWVFFSLSDENLHNKKVPAGEYGEKKWLKVQ